MRTDESHRSSIFDAIEKTLPGFICGEARNFAFQPIDSGAVVRRNRRPYLPVSAVEPLVEEMIELLGRCLENRRYKFDLEEKAIGLWMTHRREWLANASRQAALAAGELSSLSAITRLEIDSCRSIAGELDAAILSQQSSLSAHDPDSPLATERIEQTATVTAYLSPQLSEAVKPHSVRLEENRLEYERMSILTASHDSAARGITNNLQFTSAEIRLPVCETRESIENKRIEDEQAIIDWRASIASHEDTALNFSQRISEVQRLFDADFNSAMDRAECITRGMQLVFGLDLPLPDLGQPSPLTALTLWARRVAEELDRIGLRTQTHVHVICLNELLSETQWQALLSSENVPIFLTKPNSYPTTLDRLRSVRFFVTEGASESTYGSVTCCVPELYSGESKAERSILVGDIRQYSDYGNHGKVASRKVVNRPPFGEWSFKFIPSNPTIVHEFNALKLYLEVQIDAFVEVDDE